MTQLVSVLISAALGWTVLTLIVLRDFGSIAALCFAGLGVMLTGVFRWILVACLDHGRLLAASEVASSAAVSETNLLTLDSAKSMVTDAQLEKLGLTVLRKNEPSASGYLTTTDEFFQSIERLHDPLSGFSIESPDILEPSVDDYVIGRYVWEHSSVWAKSSSDVVFVRADDEPGSPELYEFRSIYHLLAYLTRTQFDGTHYTSSPCSE